MWLNVINMYFYFICCLFIFYCWFLFFYCFIIFEKYYIKNCFMFIKFEKISLYDCVKGFICKSLVIMFYLKFV